MTIKQPLAHLLISVTKKYLSIFSQQTDGLDIDRYQYVIVLIHLNNEQLTQKALCEILEVDKSFMVHIVDYLSSKGYVFRQTNESDRRQQLIKLTQKAKDAVPKIEAVITRLNKKSLENLSEVETKIFSDVLLQISSNLSEIKPKGITINYKK
ncbi:MAG: MarR family winged helix-turn-helix transcriptional regulator [Sphingobacteriaceae bacterium]